MALRIGFVELGLEASGSDMDWLWIFGAWVGLGGDRSWVVLGMLARAVQKAINNQLRTDTVKGNPTA